MTKQIGANLLESWVREAISDRDKDDQPCTMLSCVHKEGARDVEVYSVLLSKDKMWEPREVAELFRHKAESHVADIPGSQLFFLYAFYGSNGETPGQRRAFRVNNSDTDFGYGSTEPPTPQGQQMQSMRHNEFSYQMSVKNTQYILETQFKLISMLTSQNMALMKDHGDVLTVAKETILSQARFESERIKEEARRQERLELLKLIPPLVNRAFGKEVFPQNTTDTRILERALSQLDESGLHKLAAILPPDTMALLAERGAKMFEERERAQTTAELALTKNGDTHEKSESDTEDLPH